MILKNPFKPKPIEPSALGIDLSMGRLRAVEVTKTATGFRVESVASEDLPPNLVTANGVESGDELERIARLVVQRLRKSDVRVCVGLPDTLFVTKQFMLRERLSDESVLTMIRQEASSFVTFPVDDAAFDWVELELTEQGRPLMVAAARQTTMDTFCDPLTAAGLSVRCIDKDSNGMLPMLGAAAGKLGVAAGAVIAFLDVGRQETMARFYRGEDLIFARTLAAGSDAILAGLVNVYGWTEEELNKRLAQGSLPQGWEESVCPGFHGHMAIEVQRALQFFYAETDHHHVDALVLSCPAQGAGGFAEVVSAQTGVRSILADPFEGMDLSPVVRALNDATGFSAGLWKATGLALRGLL